MMIFFKKIKAMRRVLVLGVSSAVFAMPTAYGTTLNEAVEAALQNHPRHEVAILQLEAASEKRREERSGFFPTVSASASGGRIYGDNSTSRGLSVTRGAGYSWLWEGNVALTQNLFNGLATVNKHGAAKDREDAARYTKDDVREALTAETVLAYLDVVRTSKGIKLLEQSLAEMEKYQPQFEILVEEGAVDSTDWNQAIDTIEGLNSLIIDYEAQHKSALGRYQMMTGSLPTETLVKPNLVLDIPGDFDLAKGWTLENHPQLLAYQGITHAAWHDAQAERASFLPKLDSEFSYYKKDQEDVIGGEVVDARALLKASWGFSLGGGELAKFKQSRKRYQETMADRRDREKTLINTLNDAWINKEKLEVKHIVLKRRAALSNALLKTRRDQFEGGQISLLQLMQSHRQKQALAFEALQLEYTQLSSDYLLLSAMGSLYSRISNQPELVVGENEDVKFTEPETKIEDFCDRHKDHKEKGKAEAKASELCH